MVDKPLVRVGILTCERNAHVRDIWGPIILPCGERRFLNVTTPMTGMVMTHVWDLDRKASEAFANCFGGIEVADHYADMVGEVDGVILSDFDSCIHYPELARPYLEAGVPIFINRPFALNLEDAQGMIEVARRHDTPIMSGSSFEYVPQVEEIRAEIADLQPISGYAAAVSTSDYATHGVHGLFFAYACVGGGIRKVAYQTPDWREPNGIVVIEHGREGETPFCGSVLQIKGPLGWMRIFGGRPRRSFEQSVGGGIYFWLPILIEMQRMFETRRMPEPYEAIYEKTQLFLAGFKSHLECGGRPVALSEIGDWRAPPLNPDPYPEGYFG